MERDFLEFFQQTVTIEPCVKDDEYGQPVYGQTASYPARVQEKVKMIRNALGQEVVSTVQVFLDGAVPVTVKDRITIPSGVKPLIQAVTAPPDEAGQIHHRVVYT